LILPPAALTDRRISKRPGASSEDSPTPHTHARESFRLIRMLCSSAVSLQRWRFERLESISNFDYAGAMMKRGSEGDRTSQTAGWLRRKVTAKPLSGLPKPRPARDHGIPDSNCTREASDLAGNLWGMFRRCPRSIDIQLDCCSTCHYLHGFPRCTGVLIGSLMTKVGWPARPKWR